MDLIEIRQNIENKIIRYLVKRTRLYAGTIYDILDKLIPNNCDCSEINLYIEETIKVKKGIDKR